MAIYIDSADRDIVEPLLKRGFFDGITTNPSILKKSGLTQKDLHDLYGWSVDAGAEKVFMQTRGVELTEIYDSASSLLDIGSRVIVKIPCVLNGLVVAEKLTAKKKNVLLTAVYHPVQALFAKELDCWGIAPYVGRMTDNGLDGINCTGEMVKILRETKCHVLAASIRSIDDWSRLAALGVQDFTVSPVILTEALNLPESVEAVKIFEKSGE